MRIIKSSLEEDLGEIGDITTMSVGIEGMARGAALVSREPGVICGRNATELLFEAFADRTEIHWLVEDGDAITSGQTLATLVGDSAEILRLERSALNMIGRLSGISTLTSEFVSRIKGTNAKVYDTRKTTPGWRLLEKYAVGCGGGNNHRMGLCDAILLKDNHLWLLNHVEHLKTELTDLVPRARAWIKQNQKRLSMGIHTIVEVEVDTLDQFQQLLPTSPDIILLDNMSTDQLLAAVELRNQSGSTVQLEASGGIRLDTIAAIASTGVDRISVGALTHSAVNFDVGLDWKND